MQNPIKWEKPEKLVPRKILQNPSYVENLWNWYSYFSHSMGAFFPLDSHSMVYFIICEIHGFPHQFPIAWKNAVTSIELGEPRKLVPIFSLTYGYFSSVRFTFYVIIYHMGNAWFFPSKSNLWALWLFFHSIIVSTCTKIYWFLNRKKQKKPIRLTTSFKKRKTNSRHAGILSKIHQKKKRKWM